MWRFGGLSCLHAARRNCHTSEVVERREYDAWIGFPTRPLKANARLEQKSNWGKVNTQELSSTPLATISGQGFCVQAFEIVGAVRWPNSCALQFRHSTTILIDNTSPSAPKLPACAGEINLAGYDFEKISLVTFFLGKKVTFPYRRQQQEG